MSIFNKFKKKSKKEIAMLERQRLANSITESKYKNMTMLCPPKTAYENDESFCYINLLDENNDYIPNEKVLIKYNGEFREYESDEKGLVTIPVNLPVGRHTFKAYFPNGNYSQSIEGKITVKEGSPKKSNKTTPESVARIYAPNMKMYSKKQIQYYIKLRDGNYNPIEGEEVKFIIDDEMEFISKTDEEGFAKIDHEFEPENYRIHVEYAGSDKYDETVANSELEVVIREVDKELMIDVDHLTMEFKVTKDKIDTLKEFIIRTLKKNKQEHEKIRVLDDISFRVYKGDRLGILGFNGAGKSTLLKIMSGIYEPTSGSITTYGKIAPLLELGAGFDKNYTGKNNIYLNGAFLSMDENFINEKYDEIVEFSELGEFINYPVKNYSSGMKSKLGFSIATTVNPDILIIDEILSVGDIKFKKKSSEKLNSMMADGVTVLLVSHSISQIKKICDRCIWLQDGKIIMDGDADEVCKAYVDSAKGKKKAKKKNK